MYKITLLLSLLLSGCAYYPVAMESSTVPLAPGSYTTLGDVHGEDCAYYILILIPVTNGNELHLALDDAMRHKPMADALVSVTVDYSVEWYVVFRRACTRVHGVAVQTQALVPAPVRTYR